MYLHFEDSVFLICILKAISSVAAGNKDVSIRAVFKDFTKFLVGLHEKLKFLLNQKACQSKEDDPSCPLRYNTLNTLEVAC